MAIDIIELQRQVWRLQTRVDTMAPAGSIPDGPYAPLNKPFVVISNDSDLTAERALLAGAGLTLTDGGTNSSVTLAVVAADASLTVNADNMQVNLASNSGLEVTTGLRVDVSDTSLALGAGGVAVNLASNSGLEISSGLKIDAADTSLSLGASGVSVALAATSGLQVSSGLMLADTVAGAGLTIADKVLAVGAGNGITVNADDVALTTPGTLTVSSSNSASGNHTHAITTSSNPGAAASILASNASGYLQLTGIGIGAAAGGANQITLADAGTINWSDIALSRLAANVLGLADGDAFESTYTSGWAGAGYHLDYNQSYASESFLELDRLSVRGIMSIYELLIHQVRATNGSIYVANTGKVKTVTDLGSSVYEIETETDHGFATNDLIRAQRFTGTGTYQSDMTVGSVPSTTLFRATLRATYTVPAAGMEFVRIGNTTDTDRQGSIYLTADDTNAPYINILAEVADFTDWGNTTKTRARIGNLNGAFGISSNYYGIGLGDYANGNYLRYETNGGLLFSFGAGKNWMDGTGTYFTVDADGDFAYQGVNFVNGATTVAKLQGTYSTGSHHTITLSASSIAAQDSYLSLSSLAPTTKLASSTLLATSGTVTMSLQLQNTDNSSRIATLKLGDAAAASYFQVTDSGDNQVAKIDSDGNITTSGSVFIGDSANAKMTQGLTINQGANDDEILALKSSDVAHGMTDVTETDTYLAVIKSQGLAGGPIIRGLSDADGIAGSALALHGLLGEAADTTKSTAGRGVVEVVGQVKSGTGSTTLGADGNILIVRNYSTTRFILDADGDSHQDVGTAWTQFDAYDDFALLNSLAFHVGKDPIKDEFKAWVTHNKQSLEQAKLVTFNDDGHDFVNMSKLVMLLVGAVRQSALKISRLETQLTEIKMLAGEQPTN